MGFKERFKEKFKDVVEKVKDAAQESFLDGDSLKEFGEKIKELAKEEIRPLFEKITDSRAFKIAMPIIAIVSAVTVPWALSGILAAAALPGANMTALSLAAAYEGYKVGKAIDGARDLVNVSKEIREEKQKEREEEEKEVERGIKLIIDEMHKQQENLKDLPLDHPDRGVWYDYYDDIKEGHPYYESIQMIKKQRLQDAENSDEWLNSLEEQNPDLDPDKRKDIIENPINDNFQNDMLKKIIDDATKDLDNKNTTQKPKRRRCQ